MATPFKKTLRKIHKIARDLIKARPHSNNNEAKETVIIKEKKTENTIAQGQSNVLYEEPKPERKFTKSQKKILKHTNDILSTIPKLHYTENDGILEGPTYSWGEYSLSYRNNNFLRGVTNRTVRSNVQYKNKPF
ncbi:hypothetical protein AKO1_003176, partial [Acrasis kona]